MLVCYEIFAYTTQDNTCTFEFAIAPYNEGFRAYILTPINYWGRPDDLLTTCRAYDQAQGLYYVNFYWSPLPPTIEACEAVIALWSDLTVAYIYTSETIYSQFWRRFYRQNRAV